MILVIIGVAALSLVVGWTLHARFSPRTEFDFYTDEDEMSEYEE
jgi:hypothetical protein